MSCMSASESLTREREIFRYYQPADLHHKIDGGKDVKTSSNDPCLTAFAQLGALRLQCKRGVIVLSTLDAEYIIAESGQALSLQQDNDENDGLWYGVGLLKREKGKSGLGGFITELFADANNCPKFFGVGDMTQDERFKDKATVVGPPHLRAMACVPLKSALHGVTIGAYVVMDDKVRGPLTDTEQQFLADMATTVTDYLEAGRQKTVQNRSDRMVKAIGLFIQGKSSLRDWWLKQGHRNQQATLQKRTKQKAPLEHQADLEFGVQETADYFSRHGLNDIQNSDHRSLMVRSPGSSETLSQSGTEPRGSSTGGTPSYVGPESRDGRPAMPNKDSSFSTSEGTTPMTAASRAWHEHDSSVTTVDGTFSEQNPDVERRPSVLFDVPHEPAQQDKSHDLQNALLSADLKSVFARASNLIRESISVEGVLYLDASIGSFGGSSEKNVMEEKAPGAFNAENNLTTSEEDLDRKSSDTENDAPKKGRAKESSNYCNVLGFSTRSYSSLYGHRIPEEHQKFPEAMLRKLLKRYPHGKVFDFNEDGTPSLSASESTASTASDGAPSKSRNPERSSRRQIAREQEAAAILAALPGARSVFWFPLWAQTRERWYSGSFVWSKSTTRTMCPVEDITYLAAFGNSTMAEVSRLSSQALSRMKSDFISSISHELRSPLHGVLASVEFLQETEMTEQQSDMVDNIHASGNVLLDTINHVLDFSKVNRRSKNKTKEQAPKKLTKIKERRESMDEAVEKADICVVSEEVIESIYIGQKVSKKAFGTSEQHKRHHSNGETNPPVQVVVDIAWRNDWTFDIDKGAWRRILMNIFSNAMKYTAEGYVKVSLEIEHEAEHHDKKSAHQNLILRVKDSGKGIHKEFLDSQLFKPFSQEDQLASGTGLGLSIVKAIVQELGGKISFVSEPETGTEATVKVPLKQSAHGAPRKDGDINGMLQQVRRACMNKSVGLVGFDRYPDLKEEPTGILDREAEGAMLLKESLKVTMRDWLGVEATTTSAPDIIVIMEAGLGEKSLTDVFEEYGSGHTEEKRVAVLLTSSYHTGPRVDAHDHFRIVYLQQPYGPHKLARVLYQAFYGSTGESQERPTHSRSTSESVPHVPGRPHSLSKASETRDFASFDGATTHHNDVSTVPKLNIPPQLWVPPAERPQSSSSPASPKIRSENPVVLLPSRQPPPPPPVSEITKPEPAHVHQIAAVPCPSEQQKPGLRVLLVEDNEINLKLLIATMRKLKLDHGTAMNGLEALNAYKDCAGKFDVIFMDISMPIMTGIDATRHIRRYEKENALSPVAVIALTGAANATTRQEAFSSGVDLFLTKPVAMKALRVMLDDLGRQGRAFFDTS